MDKAELVRAVERKRSPEGGKGERMVRGDFFFFEWWSGEYGVWSVIKGGMRTWMSLLYG